MLQIIDCKSLRNYQGKFYDRVWGRFILEILFYFINLYLPRANCNSTINSFHQGLFQNIAILQRYFEKKVYDVLLHYVLSF